MHGYAIMRRIEQPSGDRLAIHYGMLYPELLKLEPQACMPSECGVSAHVLHGVPSQEARRVNFSTRAPVSHAGPQVGDDPLRG